MSDIPDDLIRRLDAALRWATLIGLCSAAWLLLATGHWIGAAGLFLACFVLNLTRRN